MLLHVEYAKASIYYSSKLEIFIVVKEFVC